MTQGATVKGNAMRRWTCLVCAAGLLAWPAAGVAQVAGGGANITVQLPTFGISIDADGTLAVSNFAPPDGRLAAERLAAAKVAKPGELQASSKLRKISLKRLAAALARELAAGQQPNEIEQNLAGLTGVQYVFCYPAANGAVGDTVLAGPAEPFAVDGAGRSIGLMSGRPIVQLDDLLVALRAYPPGTQERKFLGCTIDPPQAGLVRLAELQRTIPRSVRTEEQASVAQSVAQGVSTSLGQAEIRVFGVPAGSHFAQVLVEADYRMKRIGIGLEPPPVRITTFAEALQAPPQNGLQRWWFTPETKCVRLTEDHLAAEIVGDSVRLQAEDKLIGSDGSLVDSGQKPSKASELFVLGFTRKYGEIAAASPVYAQLRTLIDLSVTAALIRRQDFDQRAACDLAVLRDDARLPVKLGPAPRRVPCAVNVFWKGARLLAPAGGGVSILPDDALAADQLLPDTRGAVHLLHSQLGQNVVRDSWWWD